MSKFDGLGVSIIDIATKVQAQPEKIEEPKEFPIDLLPGWLQKTIKEHAESYGTPPELWATAFLSGIAAAAGEKIYLNNGNYRNYPQLWLIIVGSSGTGKSEAFRVAFRKIMEIDSDKFARYKEAFRDWEANDRAGAAPRWEQSIIGDTTPEALFNVLANSNNGLTLYRDELSGWFADFGRYNKSGEVGHYISIFDNQNLSINRKKEQPQLITEPFLNICGTIQPSVLSELLEKKDFELSGFAQRFLFLYPEFSTRKYRRTIVQPSTEFYDRVIATIVSDNGDENEMYLCDDAEDRYEEFFNEMEDRRSRSNDFWAAVFSKAQIQVLRLALTVKIARLVNEPSNQVSETDMQAAIEMMRYFIGSLEKFKTEQKETISKKAMIQEIFRDNPDVRQTEIARMMGVSKQYVNKVVGRRLTVDDSPNIVPQPFIEKNEVNQNKLDD